ncbi:MAG TPA: hypothetical protein CFH79_00765 [Sulfurospirillum sp. UBA11407]|nr:MAG TPA: hypothetical protein CFH79_00765 [Sulfurospirillum sp. UBA11407]
MNEYIDFYEKNKISPVRQNIDDFSLHVKRRKGLYRQLGLLPSSFEGKKILEVGPGGGYNALVTATFKPEKYVLIEPNTTGFRELKRKFETSDINENVEFHNCLLEEFTCKEKFDVVLCEGLVQGLPNRSEFLSTLGSFVKEEGVLVITVADEISMFFEILRRYLANELLKNETDFEKQIEILVEAFSSHLDTLKGMTRRYDDWCADLLCDAIYNHTFSVADAIAFFQNEYFFYGASPNIFQDFRWYKALPNEPFDYNANYLQQFNTHRHNFINSNCIYESRDEGKNLELSDICKKLITVVKSLEKKEDIYEEKVLYTIFDDLKKNISTLDIKMSNAVEEVRELVGRVEIDQVAQMKQLSSLFGRGQIFVSFVKSL